MTRKSKSKKQEEEWITQVKPADVLFGRGSGPNDHEGNVRFRALVADRKAEYLATTHRGTKADIARQIVDTVWNAGGRFLKRVDGGVDAWCVVDKETTMEKAKQALRQNRERASGAAGGTHPLTTSAAAAAASTAADTKPASPQVPSKQATVTPEPSGDFSNAKRSSEAAAAPPSVPVEKETRAAAAKGATALLDIGFSPTGARFTVENHGEVPIDPALFEPIPVEQMSQEQRLPSGLEAWADFAGASNQSNALSQGGAPDSVASAGGSRRESLQISDLVRDDPFTKSAGEVNSDVMDDLVDGVLRMSTQSMLDESGDSATTMGTVELPRPDMGPRGMSSSTSSTKNSNMSGVSMAGSDSSFLDAAKLVTGTVLPVTNTTNTTAAVDPGTAMRLHPQQLDLGDGGNQRRPSKGFQGSEASLELSDIWRRESLFASKPAMQADAILEVDEDDVDVAPRRVSVMDNDPDNMSYLGSSSMSVIKTAMGRSGDSAMSFSKGQMSDLIDDLQGEH